MPDVRDRVTHGPNNEQSTDAVEDRGDLLRQLAWMLYERNVLSEADYHRLFRIQEN
jgi:hypothetical protein